MSNDFEKGLFRFGLIVLASIVGASAQQQSEQEQERRCIQSDQAGRDTSLAKDADGGRGQGPCAGRGLPSAPGKNK